MNRRRIVGAAVAVSAAVGAGSVYRQGEWSMGPSSLVGRESCAESGGREVDMVVMHHCASGSAGESTPVAVRTSESPGAPTPLWREAARPS